MSDIRIRDWVRACLDRIDPAGLWRIIERKRWSPAPDLAREFWWFAVELPVRVGGHATLAAEELDILIPLDRVPEKNFGSLVIAESAILGAVDTPRGEFDWSGALHVESPLDEVEAAKTDLAVVPSSRSPSIGASLSHASARDPG